MAEKRFTIEENENTYTFNDYKQGSTTGFITDDTSLYVMEEMCRLLNELDKENERLRKEKESWKSSALNNSSFNSILLHELDLAVDQGYKVSNPFKKLMEEKNDNIS